MYHCGYIDEDDWIEYAGPPHLGVSPHTVSLTQGDDKEPFATVYCPGYLPSLSQVVEAWQAYQLRKDGLFHIRFPGREQVLIDMTDQCVVAVGKYEDALMAKAERPG